MKRRKPQLEFVLCIRNHGCDDLETRKVYLVLRDPSAAKDGYLRVVDESGEDYLYPADYFVPIALPEVVAKSLAPPPNKAASADRAKVPDPRRRSMTSGRPGR